MINTVFNFACKYLRNDFNFWNVNGITNTSQILCKRPDVVMIPRTFQKHTLYPGCNIFVYIADQKQPNTSRARMDSSKLTLFLLLQTLKRGVASQDFAEKQSVPTFMFRHR